MSRQHYVLLTVLLFFCGTCRSDDGDISTRIATVGDRIVLPCLNNEPEPVRWTKGDRMISFSTQVIGDKSKFDIEKPASNEWNLVIKNIVPSDEAVYSCRYGSDRILTQRRLKVETKPQINERASSPESMEVLEDETVTIWCNVSGTPEPTVTWLRRMGQEDPPVAIGVTGNELTIHNITRYASDIYICEVSNQHGSVSRTITITVKFPVVATVYEEEVAADLGEEVVIACMVAGEPIYNAYWKDVNGDRIYTSWHYKVTSENVRGFPLKMLTLMIRRSTLEGRDYGTYTCHAAGDTSESEARVRLKPPG